MNVLALYLSTVILSAGIRLLSGRKIVKDLEKQGYRLKNKENQNLLDLGNERNDLDILNKISLLIPIINIINSMNLLYNVTINEDELFQEFYDKNMLEDISDTDIQEEYVNEVRIKYTNNQTKKKEKLTIPTEELLTEDVIDIFKQIDQEFIKRQSSLNQAEIKQLEKIVNRTKSAVISHKIDNYLYEKDIDMDMDKVKVQIRKKNK